MLTQRRARRALRIRVIPVLAAVLLLAVLASPAMAAPPPSPAAITSATSTVLAATSTSAKAAKRPAWKRRRAAVRFARRQVGKPYRWGGEGPKGYDCSGLTLASWKRGGKRLPHSSRLQAKKTKRVRHYRNIRKGDLLFYGKPVHHVAIYVGKGKMIEAPRRGLNVRKVSAKRRGRVKIGRLRGL